MQIIKRIKRKIKMYKMGKIGRVARVRYFDNWNNRGMIEEYVTNIKLASLYRLQKENAIFISQVLPINKSECNRIYNLITE